MHVGLTRRPGLLGNSQLHRLRRRPEELAAYLAWKEEVIAREGSMQRYLESSVFPASFLSQRLETRAPSPSMAEAQHGAALGFTISPTLDAAALFALETLPSPSVPLPPYFTRDIASTTTHLRVNDWPYSIPSEVKHYVLWSVHPFIHPSLIPRSYPSAVREKAWTHIRGKGLTGLVGCEADANTNGGAVYVAVDDGESDEEQATIEAAIWDAGREMRGWVANTWKSEYGWEAAWFINPPVRLRWCYYLNSIRRAISTNDLPQQLQSIPALPHFHIL